MRFVLPRESLVVALQPAAAIADKRSTTPILSSVLLQATPAGLRLTTTDKALTYIGTTSADVHDPGEIAVDAANLTQIAAVLPSGPVTIETAGNNRVVVKAGSAVFKLSAYAAAEFPVLPSEAPKSSLSIAAADLRRVIDQVLADVADDDNRYGLNGVHLEAVGPEALRMVATDGNRLAYSEAAFTGELGMRRKMLVPRKPLFEVRKRLDKLDASVTIEWLDRAVVFRLPDATLHARLVEADFPDYRQVLPAGFKRRVLVDRTELLAAVKRVGVFATDGAHSVRFAFTADELVLTARKLDAGDARAEVAAELSGEPITLGMNARFVQDALGAIGGGRVAIEMGDTLSPVILRDPDDARAMFVVMPVRLS